MTWPPHQMTWHASKQVTSPPWNSRRLVHSKEMVWASRWSVALRTFYRQILSLLYSSFFFWNFRPRLDMPYVQTHPSTSLQQTWKWKLEKTKLVFQHVPGPTWVWCVDMVRRTAEWVGNPRDAFVCVCVPCVLPASLHICCLLQWVKSKALSLCEVVSFWGRFAWCIRRKTTGATTSDGAGGAWYVIEIIF